MYLSENKDLKVAGRGEKGVLTKQKYTHLGVTK